MKKLFILIPLLLFSFNSNSFAQTETANYTTSQATTVNSLWSTFNSYAQSKQYAKAIESGIKLSKDFSANKKYKEAFATCRDMDGLILLQEKETQKPDYSLRYNVTKERLRLYMNIKKLEQSKALLDQLQTYSDNIASNSIKEDLLLTKASFFHKFEMEDKSIACYKQLIAKRAAGKGIEETGNCYKDMLTFAEENNNAALAQTIKKIYNNWQDSIKVANTAEEKNVLQQKFTESQSLLDEKESTIKANVTIIVILCVISVGLAVGALFLLGLLFKSNRKNKKLKTSLLIANNNNEQKSNFISNISSQINPSLNKIEEEIKNLPAQNIAFKNINALKNLTNDIHTFIGIEETRDEIYPMEDFNVFNLCEGIMDKAKSNFKDGVDAEVKVPKVAIRSNPEAIEKILLHLLLNAAKYTESGKISLEFKKRSAHSGQFLVTDTGESIPEEKQNEIFKPFTSEHDITKGTGLGLPTCAIMAMKLKGNIHIDTEHKKGTRFVLELHS